MSDAARSFAKSRLESFVSPDDLPVHAAEEDDGASSASSMSSTGTIIAPAALQRQPPTAVSWTDFYKQEFYLQPPEGSSPKAKFHVYYDPPASPKDPLIVLHHGAGSSAMSWALCAKEIRTQLPACGILSMNAREHGSVVWDDAGNIDQRMDINLLAQDLVTMIHLTKSKLGWTELPRMLLIGHSLGGAIVTHAAKSGALGSKVIGFGVLDVVEGSALEALKHMQAYLRTRPSTFKTMDLAIEWHVKSRTLRNIKSARASVPALFYQDEAGLWRWKTDLSSTDAYWENWFSGMSSKFLTARGAKLLILAGTDRLDKELMIGQMQGKFQLLVMPEAGHFVQEDAPQKTATIIVDFFRRNDQTAFVMPPKVSEMLARGEKV